MALFKITKKTNCHTFKIRNSRALGGTSRVVLELKPFGISIRRLIGSEPWVGRSTGKMSGNSIGHQTHIEERLCESYKKVTPCNLAC